MFKAPKKKGADVVCLLLNGTSVQMPAKWGLKTSQLQEKQGLIVYAVFVGAGENIIYNLWRSV